MSVTVNPVLARELRQRMRGPRAYVVTTLYLSMVGLVIFFAWLNERSQDTASTLADRAGFGRVLFHIVLLVMVLLVCFIVPGLTAGAIAVERERQTLVPLQVTPLSPRQILTGKLAASIVFVLLLIVATLPIAGASFLYGGVRPLEVARGVAMVVAVAITLGCIGMLMSTTIRRAQGAVVASYACTFLLLLGTFAGLAAQAIVTRTIQGSSLLVLSPNPLMAVASGLDGADQGLFEGGFVNATVFSPFQELIRQRTERSTVFAPDGSALGERDVSPLSVVPFWLQSLLSLAALSVLSMVVAARRLRVPSVTPP